MKKAQFDLSGCVKGGGYSVHLSAVGGQRLEIMAGNIYVRVVLVLKQPPTTTTNKTNRRCRDQSEVAANS
jgi:hypothetical protein